MGRTPTIAGNWKMNTTLPEAVALVEAMRARLEQIHEVEVVVCPPFVSLAAVSGHLHGSRVLVGAQNVHFADKGAFTGEVSPLMLRDLATYVIAGHSERRQYFGETDELVARKVKAVMEKGMKPIMCVGETLDEHERGQTEAVVTRQVRAGLAGLEDLRGLVIAYEPIWAIGTGKPATGTGANETISIIRRTVGTLFGAQASDALRIQYGGSVTPDNIREFMEQPEIDGALVGGASLKAEAFVEIVRQTAAAKR